MTLKNNTKLDHQTGNDEPDLVELFRAMFNSEIGKQIMKKSNPKSLDDLVGKDGIAAQFLKPFIEEISKAELVEHLGYEKHSIDGYNSGNSRNGSYNRNVNTSEGPVEILVPRDRNGEFKPHLLDAFKRSSPEFEAKIMALYARGATTKDIADFVEETYGVEISESFVSDITDKVLDLQKEWQSRELQGTYAFAYLDAVHIPTRIDGKVGKRALHVVLAYDLEGHKEVLGHYLSHEGEGAKFWLSVLQDLQNRGVNDILIISVDGLNGFKEAIESVFPETLVQRCVIHAIRNSLKYVTMKDRKAFMEGLKPVYRATTREEAYAKLEALSKLWNDKYPMALRVWFDNWEELSLYFDFSPPIRKMIYTTNPIESYNSILRKYTRNRKSFPTEESLLKVAYLAAKTASSKWGKQRAEWQLILNQLAIQFEGRV